MTSTRMRCCELYLVYVVIFECLFLASSTWIDMSYPLDEKTTLHYPGTTEFTLKTISKGYTKNDYWYESNEFCTSEHLGTHLDAPKHFNEKGWAVDEIPVEKLFLVPVVRIDISTKAQASPYAMLKIEDLENWEKINGRIPSGAVVVLYSAWGQHYPNPYAFFGTPTPRDATTLSYPGFDPAAVQWLVDNRNVNGIGTDGPSIESPKTTEHKAHRAMAAKNGYNLEMLGSVEQLTQSGSFMIIGPMKIRGGSGSPARVYGLVPPFTAEESALIKKTAKSVIADWSYDLAPDTLRWPTGSAFRSQPENLNKNLGYWFYMNNVCMPEHIGTHLDAPVHFSKDGLSVADIEIQHFISNGVVIDVEQTMAKSPNKEDFLLTEEDVTNWELKFGRVPEGSIIFMRSGWGSRWPNWESYYGTPSYNDTTKLHFPGYSASAAKFLVEDRTVAGLGIDTPSVDYGPSQDFKTHQVGLENDVFNLENVAGLKYIYSGVYPVVVLPVKIQGGSGAPARIFALIEGDLSSVRRNEAASHSSHDHDDNGDHDHDDDSYASHLGYNQLLLILMPVFVTAIFNLLN